MKWSKIPTEKWAFNIPNLKAWESAKAQNGKRKDERRLSSLFTAMQTLLLPATRAGSFTAVPLSASAVAAPRLPQPFLRPNSLPSLPLNLTLSSSSFSNSIARQPWTKLPFTASASSQVSPAFTPSNDESEKAKLELVLLSSFRLFDCEFELHAFLGFQCVVLLCCRWRRGWRRRQGTSSVWVT